MTQLCMWHDSIVCAIWPIRNFNMNRTHLCYDPSVCMALSLLLWYFVLATRLNCMCDMTLLYLWHDSNVCATWLNCTCDMTQLYMWHDSIVCVSHFSIVHGSMCHFVLVGHSFIRDAHTWSHVISCNLWMSHVIREWVMSLWLSHVWMSSWHSFIRELMHMWHASFIRDMT